MIKFSKCAVVEWSLKFGDGSFFIPEEFDIMTKKAQSLGSGLNSFTRLLLEGYVNENEGFGSLYEFLFSDFTNDAKHFDVEDFEAWNHLFESVWRDYHLKKPAESLELLRNLISSSYPILIDEPIDDQIYQMSLSEYLEKTVVRVFHKKLLELRNESGFKDLLKSVKMSSDWKSIFNYLFLINIPSQYQYYPPAPILTANINEYFEALAEGLYELLPKDETENILSRLLPSVYDNIPEGLSYKEIIEQFVLSQETTPVDTKFIIEELKMTLEMIGYDGSKCKSPFLLTSEQVKLLKDLVSGLPEHKDMVEFVVRNFKRPKLDYNVHQLIAYLMAFTFSLSSRLSSINTSKSYIKENVTFLPVQFMFNDFLSYGFFEVCDKILQEQTGDQDSMMINLDKLVYKGKLSAIRFVVKNKNRFDNLNLKEAFLTACSIPNFRIAKLIYEQVAEELTSEDKLKALKTSIKMSKTKIVEYFLTREGYFTDPYHVVLLLIKACKYGDVKVFKVIHDRLLRLGRHRNMCKPFNDAIKEATYRGSIDLIKLFIDCNSEYMHYHASANGEWRRIMAGESLRIAAKIGNLDVVEYIAKEVSSPAHLNLFLKAGISNKNHDAVRKFVSSQPGVIGKDVIRSTLIETAELYDSEGIKLLIEVFHEEINECLVNAYDLIGDPISRKLLKTFIK